MFRPGRSRTMRLLLSFLALPLVIANAAWPACADSPPDTVTTSDIRLRDTDFSGRGMRAWEIASFPRFLRVFPVALGSAAVVCQDETGKLFLCYVKDGECRSIPALTPSGSPLLVSSLSPFSLYGDADRVVIGMAHWKCGKPVDASSVQFYEYSDGALLSSRCLPLPEPGFRTEGLIPVGAAWCGDETLAMVLQFSERHFDPSKVPEAPYSHFTKFCSLWFGEEPGEYQPIVEPGAFKTSKLAFESSSNGSLHAAWVEERRGFVRIMYSTSTPGSGWARPEAVAPNKGKTRMSVTRLMLSVSQDRIHIVWGVAGKGTFLCSRQAPRFSQPEAIDNALEPLHVFSDSGGGVSVVLKERDRISILRRYDSNPIEKHALLTVPSSTRVRRTDAGTDHEGNIHIVYFAMSAENRGYYQYKCFAKRAEPSE